MEKVSKRANAILEVKESVTLLSQLLQGYSKESCSQSNQELVKVSATQHIQTRRVSEKQQSRDCVCFQDLFQRCEKMRPTLFRLASDTEDNDEALGEHQLCGCCAHPSDHDSFNLSPFTADILQANDSLTQVINRYRQLVQGEDVAADDITAPQPSRCTCVFSFSTFPPRLFRRS